MSAPAANARLPAPVSGPSPGRRIGIEAAERGWAGAAEQGRQSRCSRGRRGRWSSGPGLTPEERERRGRRGRSGARGTRHGGDCAWPARAHRPRLLAGAVDSIHTVGSGVVLSGAVSRFRWRVERPRARSRRLRPPPAWHPGQTGIEAGPIISAHRGEMSTGGPSPTECPRLWADASRAQARGSGDSVAGVPAIPTLELGEGWGPPSGRRKRAEKGLICHFRSVPPGASSRDGLGLTIEVGEGRAEHRGSPGPSTMPGVGRHQQSAIHDGTGEPGGLTDRDEWTGSHRH